MKQTEEKMGLADCTAQADDEQPILRVKGIGKQYGEDVWGCRDISFELYPGEIIGIVGESGSGKSTLVRCLNFDIEATTGEVMLSVYKDGQENVLAESDQKKQHIRSHLLGMVYQNPHLGLKMSFSSSGNIAEKLLAADCYHVGDIRARAAELLGRMEIPVLRMDEPPGLFSGGMQQRVQIAKALANRPPLLLLDEVTTGLDLSVQAKVLDLIRELQRELNVSMIVVSHDLGVIRMLAERTMVLKGGRIIEQGLTDQILEDPQHPYTQLLVHSML
jgi:putative phosphonate transport system ATP-binding protein